MTFQNKKNSHSGPDPGTFLSILFMSAAGFGISLWAERLPDFRQADFSARQDTIAAPVEQKEAPNTAETEAAKQESKQEEEASVSAAFREGFSLDFGNLRSV